MTRRKYAAGLGVIACLLTSSAAFAADATRADGAILAPAAKTAPTQGIRTATPLKKKKSNALSRNGAIVLGIAGAVAIGTAIVVATDDDDEADSPG